MPCQVGTIRQIHQHLHDEGYLVSQYTLRQWVKTGVLPAVFVGSKALISFANVIGILDNGLPPGSTVHPRSESNPSA